MKEQEQEFKKWVMGQSVEFRDIPNHLGYKAGSDGSIWSCWKMQANGYGKTGGKQVLSDKWKCLKGYPRREDGRLRYTLKQNDGKYRRKYGSHFILEAFVGPKPEGMECCHNDGNCLNNAIENLRWDTIYANRADMVKHRTACHGEDGGNAKLTDKQAEYIINCLKKGDSVRSLANKFNVTIQAIHYIKMGRRKKSLKKKEVMSV